MNTWLDTSSAENDVEVTPEHKPGMNQYCQGNVNRNTVSEREQSLWERQSLPSILPWYDFGWCCMLSGWKQPPEEQR